MNLVRLDPTVVKDEYVPCVISIPAPSTGVPNAAGHVTSSKNKSRKRPDVAMTDAHEDESSSSDSEEFVARDKRARQEEKRGALVSFVIHNDGSLQNLRWLMNLKVIFTRQLPKMPKEYISMLSCL